MSFQKYKITNPADLNLLLHKGLFWRKKIGLIGLAGSFENHPDKDFYQNELNTHYYACGCDESANGFFIGVILGSLWVAASWFEGVIPGLITIAVGILFALAGAILGKAVGKLIANKKLKQTVLAIRNEWPAENDINHPDA